MSSVTNVKVRSWCWTWWDWKEADCKYICEHQAGVRFTIFAKEHSKDGRPHLQGYSEFDTAQRMSFLKNLWQHPQLHLEPRKGSREQAAAYCMGWESPITITKDGLVDTSCTFRKDDATGPICTAPNKGETGAITILGEWIKGQGSKSPYNKVVEAIARGDALSEIIHDNPEMAVKHLPNLERIEATFKSDADKELLIEKYKSAKLKPWQQELVDELSRPADDRHIIWYVDVRGGCGKSFLSRWMRAMKGAFMWNAPMITKNITYAWNKESICMFDLTREKQEVMNYGVLEMLKGGEVSSDKYVPVTKICPSNVHIVCFANWEPNYNMLSSDRWDVRFLEQECVVARAGSSNNSQKQPSVNTEAGNTVPPPISLLTSVLDFSKLTH